MPLNFAEIRNQRNSLADSLIAWRDDNDNQDKLWGSQVDRPSGDPPSYSCSSICVQALIETAEARFQTAARESGARIRSALSSAGDTEFRGLPAEVQLSPHTMNNAWAAFVVLQCFPEAIPDVTPGINWLLDAQENGWWNLVKGTPVQYPIFGAYALVTLSEYVKCAGHRLNGDVKASIEKRIKLGVQKLIDCRAKVGTRLDVLLWHTKLTDTEKIGLGTSAVCAHAVDKAARLFGNESWSDMVRRTMGEIARGFEDNPIDPYQFSIDNTPVVLWDTVNQVRPIGYSWSAFSPLSAVSLIRHLGPENTPENARIYRLLRFFVDWIGRNRGAIANKPGVHPAPNSPYVTTWSTAGAVITLSRIIAKEATILRLENAMTDQSPATPTGDIQRHGREVAGVPHHTSTPLAMTPTPPVAPEVSGPVALNDTKLPVQAVIGAMPPAGRNNVWYRHPVAKTVIVFVHGVLSDSRECWLNTDDNPFVFWPHLVADDIRFAGAGIFLGGYHTAIDAADYDLRDSATELFDALQRRDRTNDRSVLENERIVFVCHSTGGAVVRHALVNNIDAFRGKKIGLVLIASPSYGSLWANWFGGAALLYGHAIARQLSHGSWSLRELDAQFKNLVADRAIPDLCGVEACEHHFVIHRSWIPIRLTVVSSQSAGRYFSAPRRLRQTDHFSCVKPRDHSHPAHELLVTFWQRYFSERSPNT